MIVIDTPKHSPDAARITRSLKHDQSGLRAAPNLNASSVQERRQHPAPAGFGGAGGAAEDCRPKPAKHVQTCGLRAGAEPGRQSEARLGTFLSEARGSGRCGSGDWRGLTTPCMRQHAMGAKRYLAALLRRPPARNDSNIHPSRMEMPPKPRPNGVCEAKWHGVEGFRAARKGEGFCFLLCSPLCHALFKSMTKE